MPSLHLAALVHASLSSARFLGILSCISLTLVPGWAPKDPPQTGARAAEKTLGKGFPEMVTFN